MTGDGKTSYAEMARRQIPPVRLEKSCPAKSPAVIIHVEEGKDYAQTVASIKSAVDFPALGDEVKRIRRTREGYALVEFSSNPRAYAAAARLGDAIKTCPGFEVVRVARFGAKGRDPD